MLEKSINNSFVFILIGLLILMNKSLFNGFPLLESTIGQLIIDGHDNNLLNSQEGFYAILVRHLSFSHSLWYVIAFQASLAFYSLNQIIEHHLKASYLSKTFILLLIALFSSVDYYISLISPHIFAFISILLFYLILKRQANTLLNALLLLLCLLMVPIQSTVIIVFSIFTIILAAAFKMNVSYKRAFLTAAICITGIVSTMSINNYFDDGFVYLKNSNITQAARAFERNIIGQYVNKNCKTENVYMRSENLCSNWYFSNILNANEFYSDMNGPFFLNNCNSTSIDKCWQERRKDFKYLLNDIKEDKKSSNMFYLAWLSSSARQFFYFSQQSLQKPNALNEIKENYPYDLKSYKHSHQYHNKTDFLFDNLIEYITILFTLAYLLYFSFKSPKNNLVVLATLGSLLIINALIVTYYQEANSNFQGRIVPIVSLYFIFKVTSSSYFERVLKSISINKVDTL